VTLTPGDVRDVRFRKPRRGERGYDEREVDVFLDRVADTLAGRDRLTAEDVWTVQFPALRQRKGSSRAEDVDAFLEQASRALGWQASASATDRRAAGTMPGFPATTSVRKPSRGGMAPSPTSRRPSAPATVSAPMSTLPPSGRFPSSSSRQAAQDEPPPRLDAGDVHHVAFLNSPPGEPAYDADEVDAFLGRIEATVAGRDTVTTHDVVTAAFHPHRQGGRGYSEAGVTAFLVLAAHRLKRLTERIAPSMRGDARTLPRKPRSRNASTSSASYPR